MADRPSADRTAELLLRFLSEPSRYRAEGRRRDAPALDPHVILKLALGRRVDFIDPRLREPGVYLKLKQAAAAYVRNLFFRPDATPYQTLGLAPGASQEDIRESFRLLMHLVHPDRQGTSRHWPDACASAANRAYAVLRDPDARSRLEREAEARAAIARAIHKAAADAEASRMPVVVLPKSRRVSARTIAERAMPEWLTAAVGGYLRRNPAWGAFAILFVAAGSFIGVTAWQGHDGMLVREARAPRTDTSVLESQLARSAPQVAAAGTAAPPKASRESSPPEVAVSLSALPPERLAGVAPPVPVEALPSVAPAAEEAPPAAEVREASAAVPPVAITSAPVTPAGVPPATAEIEALFASLVETYERGRLDAFAALFDDDADTNLRHGRAAIRGEYDELFRLSLWRRMQLTRVNWKRVGDRAIAKGEIVVRIAWRDGKEVEQRLNVDMELTRRDGRVVIARLMHQPKVP